MRYLIDPENITDYSRGLFDLEAFWLFSVLVAGKNARIQAQKLAEFLEPAFSRSPFDYIRELDAENELESRAREHGLGQYNRILRCFRESLGLNLKCFTLEELEAVHGVGPKTSRFFALHSNPHARLAVLDTHILKWMGEELGLDVPRATPQSKKRYAQLEQAFLQAADDRGLTPAELDLQIWKQYSKGLDKAA